MLVPLSKSTLLPDEELQYMIETLQSIMQVTIIRHTINRTLVR